MDAFFVTIITGLIATACMSLLLWINTRSQVANAEMIRAVGSIFSRSYDKSFLPGLVIHFIVGTIIAFFYVALINLFAPASLAGSIAIGGMIGVFHGVAFGFTLVIAVAEHHPLEMFRTAGVEVAIAHFVGHVLYGMIVGLIVGLTGIKLFTSANIF